MKITDAITYIGVTDKDIDLFEGQYVVPEGMLYNSYVLEDEHVAVFDTVDKNFKDEWLAKLTQALNGRTPDYLIVNHMEPDHSANIKVFMDLYPECKVVATVGAFNMMKNYFETDYASRRIVAKDGDTLSLGKHTLKFITAPLVHWPEVMVTYEMTEKVLFSADAFGKFGSDFTTYDWACEARRYYFGIVGKFGDSVQKLFAKVQGVEINKILPLHGPILEENLGYYLGLYNTWSSYQAEDKGVVICYTSVYGHTKEYVEKLAEKVEAKGLKCSLFDLARCDEAEAVEDAFRYDTLILATQTYNGGVFPFMRDFINTLADHNYQNRRIALIENGTWAPMANKGMKAVLDTFKNITYTETQITIRGAAKAADYAAMDKLVAEL